MYFRSFKGRVSGLLLFIFLSLQCHGAGATSVSASSKSAEVAIKYKSAGLAEFRLADYEGELVECSALAAIHMWIGDNIGQDAGSEVRRSISEDYWLEISKDYLSLAKEASGRDDLSAEFRKEVKGLTVEWRRLTESDTSASEWANWYDLVDRCETWRPKNARRSYYTRGRESIAGRPQTQAIVGR
jgi:hypothetical protein